MIKQQVRPPHLLLVEDSEVNQVVAVTMLSALGYQVDTVENGLEAVQAVRERPYDLVLMDLAMPVMDGFDAATEIRKLPSPQGRIPIIAITANVLPEVRERCLTLGMNDYLTKPIDRSLLLAALERWLPLTTAPSTPVATPAESVASDAVLDAESLQQLEADTQPELLSRVVGLFIDETKARLAQIDRAVSADDWKHLQREAHTLKSSAGAFGARQLQDLAQQLDAACRNEDYEQAYALVQSITAVAAASLEALTKRYPRSQLTKAEDS